MPQRIEDDRDSSVIGEGHRPSPAGDSQVPKTPERGFDPLDIYRERQRPQRMQALPRLARTALRLARAASPKLFVVVVVMSATGAALLGLQVVLGKVAIAQILAQSRGDADIGVVLPVVVALVAASALSGLASAAQTQLQRLLAERVQRNMWSAILGVTTSVPLATFESPSFFDDLQRVRTNALAQPTSMTQGLLNLIAGLLAVVGLGIAVALIQPLLLVVLLLGTGPLWLITRRSGRLEFDFAVDQTPRARLRFYLGELLSGRNEAKEIRAFALGPTISERWDVEYAAYLEDLSRHVRRRIGLALLSAVVTIVVTALAIGLLLRLVFNGDLALASAAAGLIAVRLLAGRFQLIFSGVGAIFEAGLFLADFESFVARRPPPRAMPSTARPPFKELRLDDVHFRYPGASREALRGIDLHIDRGEVVALVGENGSGKTTLAKLLGLLFDPSSGRLTWDGEDTREFDIEAARTHVGVIFQDFIRYQLSARENISFGRTGAAATDERVASSAQASGAASFLDRLPDGYATGLGKEYVGGVDLSLGQWQRVALARAFFRDAAFLILDEPTASLDARAEHELFEHVRRLAEGRSLLLISHRFSTVMMADRIYVLHDGEIVESGSHAELLALEGRYAELFELQARSYR